MAAVSCKTDHDQRADRAHEDEGRQKGRKAAADASRWRFVSASPKHLHVQGLSAHNADRLAVSRAA